MTNRLGASTGVALRQLLMRSVRSNTNKAKANSPTANALTCTMAYTGRALIWRVANMSHGGALPSTTVRRSTYTAAGQLQHGWQTKRQKQGQARA